MQALAPQQNLENPPATAQEPSARISMRGVTALELASVLVSAVITEWAIIPLQPRQRWLAAVPGMLAMALIVNSQRVRGESPRDVGLSLDHFSRALRLVLGPTVIACLGLAAVGYFANSFHRTSHFWLNAAATPLWALIQQYALQGFIYRRVRFLIVDGSFSPAERTRRVRLAVLATAAIFSLAHAPNPMLMALTFTGGLIWSWVYQRAPNLFAVALSHAVISLMLMTSLPPWLLPSMSVGYKHFLYQKF
jgi:membrane protease YdiL (CAAX protease family)